MRTVLAISFICATATAAPNASSAPGAEDRLHAPAERPAPQADAARSSEPAIAPEATTSSDPDLLALDPEATPVRCRGLAEQATSPSRARALSARIALARCLFDHKLRALVLCDCEESVRAADAASQIPLRLLDEVFVGGSPALQVLARHATGDLMTDLAARLIATVPPPINATEAASVLSELRREMLRPLVEPWLVRARSAYLELERIARAHPSLARNPAVVNAVRASRAWLAEGVATR